MQERQEIIYEYFQLRVFLNRANKLPDQSSELRLILSEDAHLDYRLIAVVEGSNEKHFLVLAIKAVGYRWSPAGFSNFHNLEKFCSEVLHSMNHLNASALEEVLNSRLRSLIF